MKEELKQAAGGIVRCSRRLLPEKKEQDDTKEQDMDQIRFSALVAIREALNCRPGDILEYSPSDENGNDK